MFVLVVVAVMVASSAGATLYVAVLMDRGLVLTVGTDKSEYAAGETVIITSELKNHGPGSVTLTFNADPAEVIIVIMDSEGGFVAQYPEIFLWVARNLATRAWDYEWLDYSRESLLLTFFRLMMELKRIEKDMLAAAGVKDIRRIPVQTPNDSGVLLGTVP